MIKLRPAGANRWVPCPGSVQLELAHPSNAPKHPTTEEGIAVAWACERTMMSWLPLNQLEPRTLAQYLGQACPENGVVITEEMVYGGGAYIESVWADAHTHIGGLRVEQQLSAHDWAEGLAGRADATWASYDRRHVAVRDLKWGHRPVAAFDNWQLTIYGLGMLSPDTETIDLIIVQPRDPRARNPVKTWPLTAAELRERGETVREAAKLARGENPPTRAGRHCLYCKAAGHCATLAAAGFGVMDTAGAAIDVEMDEPQIAYELEMMDRAEALAKARRVGLEALAVSRIQTGHPVPGYGYRSTLGNRQWAMPTAEVLAFGQLMGADLAETKPASPAQATVRGIPKDTVDMFTTRRDGAPKLVRLDPAEAREAFKK